MRPTDLGRGDPADLSAAGAVLAKAAHRAAHWMGLTHEELRAALGVEGLEAPLPAGSPAWYAALSLVQLAFQLERLAGSAGAHQWLRGRNTGLGRRPIDVLVEPGGAATLVDYTYRFLR